jgi:hypothetical protein
MGLAEHRYGYKKFFRIPSECNGYPLADALATKKQLTGEEVRAIIQKTKTI